MVTEPVYNETDAVRTKIYAAGICCPSEVPLIKNLLTPLPGVAKVILREQGLLEVF